MIWWPLRHWGQQSMFWGLFPQPDNSMPFSLLLYSPLIPFFSWLIPVIHCLLSEAFSNMYGNCSQSPLKLWKMSTPEWLALLLLLFFHLKHYITNVTTLALFSGYEKIQISMLKVHTSNYCGTNVSQDILNIVHSLSRPTLPLQCACHCYQFLCYVMSVGHLTHTEIWQLCVSCEILPVPPLAFHPENLPEFN